MKLHNAYGVRAVPTYEWKPFFFFCSIQELWPNSIIPSVSLHKSDWHECKREQSETDVNRSIRKSIWSTQNGDEKGLVEPKMQLKCHQKKKKHFFPSFIHFTLLFNHSNRRRLQTTHWLKKCYRNRTSTNYYQHIKNAIIWRRKKLVSCQFLILILITIHNAYSDASAIFCL